MAVIRKKEKREVATYSSSSMSDIIFMLLFFFMITTTMRETEMLVQVRLPEATEVQKLEKKSLASYIYIGSPTGVNRQRFGDNPLVQLNDAYKQPWEIGEFIASERDQLNEADKPSMTVVLKADQFINMGLVTDVKQELRRAEAYKIVYAAIRKEQQ